MCQELSFSALLHLFVLANFVSSSIRVKDGCRILK